MVAQFSRRAFLGGVAGSAALLALPAAARARALYGPAPGIVRLSSNENPYGPSPKALEAAVEAAAKGAYYPGPVNRDLVAAIAERNGLGTDQVMTTSGSMEVLFATADAFRPYGRIVAPSLTFGPHLNRAERMGGEVTRVPLTDAMDQDLATMAAMVDNTVSLVYVCNPNNPTGVTIDGARLREFVREVSRYATVMIDEAYNEVTDAPEATSMVDLVRAGENVIVTRTFSKIFGLAGMRVGYAMAPPHLIETLSRRQMTRPNLVGAAAALASYDDEAFIAYSRSKIAEGREMVTDLFTRLEIPYLESQTNFVYADIGRNADVFQARMRERGILIRGIYAPYDTWSRVSMGRLEDLERFVRVFEEVYAVA
jgi:histidinol-phosphate aminotransferase